MDKYERDTRIMRLFVWVPLAVIGLVGAAMGLLLVMLADSGPKAWGEILAVLFGGGAMFAVGCALIGRELRRLGSGVGRREQQGALVRQEGRGARRSPDTAAPRSGSAPP